MRAVYVNEAFRPQRVSGQQRYASEISDRLPADVRRVAPGPFWSASALRTWVWVQTILPLRTWRGVLVSLTARAPAWHPRHVLVVHDLFVIEHPEWFSRKFQLTHAPLLRFQLATARCLAAVSEPVAQQLRVRRSKKMVVVAPNAPSRVFATALRGAADRGAAEDILSAFGVSHEGYLLVVGNMDPRKNLQRLAAAFGMLDDEQRSQTPLVVVGGGADIYRHADIQWPTGTIVTGYLDDETLRLLYAHCRAVLFPSLAEGFGLPIVEAVVAGAPRLLLSDIPVFRWICGQGAAYVDATSVEQWTAALQPDQIDEISPPDRSIGSRFSWSDSATTICDTAEMIGHRSATRDRVDQ